MVGIGVLRTEQFPRNPALDQQDPFHFYRFSSFLTPNDFIFLNAYILMKIKEVSLFPVCQLFYFPLPPYPKVRVSPKQRSWLLEVRPLQRRVPVLRGKRRNLLHLLETVARHRHSRRTLAGGLFVGTKAELEAYLSDEMHEQRKAAEEAFNGMQIL